MKPVTPLNSHPGFFPEVMKMDEYVEIDFSKIGEEGYITGNF